MKIKIQLTIYSKLRRHNMERVLSVAVAKPCAFTISVWEWSWAIGLGSDLDLEWVGPFLSYNKPRGEYPGYWTAALSANLWWNSA